jgi:hypothetical protein
LTDVANGIILGARVKETATGVKAMKRKYKTDLTKYGKKIAKAIIHEIEQFGMAIEVEGLVVFHQRKLTQKEAAFIKGFAYGLSYADWDVD